MKKRIWSIRLLITLIALIIVLMIALLLKDQFIVNYLNTSFIISLIFLMFAGIAYTITYGFWEVFGKGAKFLFSTRDDKKDRDHFKHEEKSDSKNETELLREAAKKELFIFLPLTVGLALLIISITLLFLI